MNVQEVVFWLRRLVNLDLRVFDEVRNNPNATIPGALIVLVTTLLAGLGGWLWWLVNGYPQSGDVFVNSTILGSLLAFLLWGLLWLGLVYVMLTQVMRQRAFLEQLMRVMGLASVPLALMVFMFIPLISFGIGLTALGLAFALTAVAIKSVTPADFSQVLLANLVGFLVWAAALTLLSSTDADFKPHAPGVFLFNSIDSAIHDSLSRAE